MAKPLVILTLVFAVLSVAFLFISMRAFKKKRIMGTASNTLAALLMLSLSALFATLTVSTQGYRAFTREEVVAKVTTRRLADQRFEARVEFADGRDTTFLLAGDEFYMDAHILKWKPLANVFGMHTDYELDRISGRYMDLQEEQDNPRTVFALSSSKPLDLFHLRLRHPMLGWLVDAEYGSGTFIATDDHAVFEVRVSTSGLLVRKTGSLNESVPPDPAPRD
ncbi:MAG: hypothetical protein JSW51_04445 [Gemmatimonadota bacterium]|nr:MAG: hypothetical protein JSW51_04445 [Gemmatimonadota bacterium]